MTGVLTTAYTATVVQTLNTLASISNRSLSMEDLQCTTAPAQTECGRRLERLNIKNLSVKVLIQYSIVSAINHLQSAMVRSMQVHLHKALVLSVVEDLKD